MASREDIEAAIERLAARGVKPSVRRKIWEELGMTGSHSQINPVLSAWRIKQAGKSAAGSPVPDELTETAMSLVTRCWALAEKKALEDAQDGRRGADLRIKEIEQKNTELKETLEKSELDVGVQEHRNGILVQKLSASEQVVVDLRGKIAGSAREIALLKERIADLTGEPVRNKGTSKSQKRAAQTNGGNTGGTSNPT